MIHIVLGSFFGDEGKGQTVHELCKEHDIKWVIRFSGGHQVGHTVIEGDTKHVFSNFGSGTLAGAATYWSKYCTVDPKGCQEERALLRAAGVEPKIFYHPLCPVVIPLDITYQWALTGNRSHGTVGVGFGTCLSRCRAGFPLYVVDCMHFNILRSKIHSIFDNYYSHLMDEGMLFNKKALDDWAWETYCYFKDYSLINPIFTSSVVFEGSQGILLDQRFGIMPYCTPSNTTSQNAFEIITDNFQTIMGGVSVEYVTRPYITRHGAGPTISSNPICRVENRNETNDYNEFQGEIRHVKFDISLLEHSIRVDELNHTVACDKRVWLRHCNLEEAQPVKEQLSSMFHKNLILRDLD